VTTVFEEEIRSQGALIRARADRGYDQASRAVAAWGDLAYCLVAARGSSDNAAVFFQYLAGRETGLLVALAAPSLFERGEVRLGGAGVLAISQSGRSPGIADVVAHARGQGRPSVVVTNDPRAPLVEVADVVIDLAAGPERALASTKTFSTTWHALAQLTSVLRAAPLAGLDDLGDVVDAAVQDLLAREVPQPLTQLRTGLTVVGRGVGYAAAREIAIKVREVAGVRAEAFSVADFLHGPIGADGEGAALLLVVTDELDDALAAQVLEGSRATGLTTTVLAPASRATLASDARVTLDDAPNWALGLVAVVFGQVLALRLGERRGRPIDSAPGLAKVTLSA
jgi:glucosamine--fructose-6-phosphate aminotransferase (isomerizing)